MNERQQQAMWQGMGMFALLLLMPNSNGYPLPWQYKLLLLTVLVTIGRMLSASGKPAKH